MPFINETWTPTVTTIPLSHISAIQSNFVAVSENESGAPTVVTSAYTDNSFLAVNMTGVSSYYGDIGAVNL